MRNLFAKWPWPVVLPFVRERAFPSLKRNLSIADEVRSVMVFGDLAIVGLLFFGTVRVCHHYTSGNYASLKYHTTGMPPALIAQDFSFDEPSSNRMISREDAKKYRAEFNSSKGPVENFIFNY